MIDNSQELIVSVNCIAYNQKIFIKDCLEGFVMQKTTFRFEAIVHDDASTDGTADIIKEYAKEYPEVIKPILEKENQWSKNNGSLEKIMQEACTGKYIAFCEGDDYWIDPYKLQKEVDYLEAHPDCSLVYTKDWHWDEKISKFSEIYGHETNFKSMMGGINEMPTPSIVIRRSKYLEYIRKVNPYSKKWKLGDFPLVLFISGCSKFKFLDEVTCVHRILSNSVSHSVNELSLLPYYRSILDVKLFFYDFLEVNDKKMLNNIYISHVNLLIEMYFKTNSNLVLEEYQKIIDNLNLCNIKLVIKYKVILHNNLLLKMLRFYKTII